MGQRDEVNNNNDFLPIKGQENETMSQSLIISGLTLLFPKQSIHK